jgi:4-amino-4-deoxy-L-arabinose transferase-like glycosyltransferase
VLVKRGERTLLALVVAVATASLAAGIALTDLWPPNETRVAEVSREMLVSRDWLVPRLNGQAFLEEPPLFYWIQAAAYRAYGAPSAFAARLPAAASAVAGVLVTMALARAVGASAGIAALVLATAPQYWWMARSGTPDTMNATATAVALLAFFVAWRSGRTTPLVIVAVMLGLAFGSKSLLGVGLAVASMGVFLVTSGWGRLRPWRLACALGVAGVAALGWLVSVGRAQGGEAVSFFVLQNHLGRLLGNTDQGHVRPVYYYVKNLALDLAPWSLALPAAIVAAWRERTVAGRRFLLAWAVAMTLLLTASASKTAHYLVPAYPAFAVLIAEWWSPGRERRIDRATWALLAVGMTVIVPILTLVVASLDPAIVLPAVLHHRPHGIAAVRLVLGRGPGSYAWVVAASALAGVGFVVAGRGRPVSAAVAVGASAIMVHLLIAWVTLPAFNPFCSARELGESLARSADGGVRLMTWGFHNREAVSPLMFYAQRPLPEIQSRHHLERILPGERACAVVPTVAYPRLPRSLRALPVTKWEIGGLGLKLVAGAPGSCPRGGAESPRVPSHPRP